MLKGCRKLFKGLLAFLVVVSTSVKGDWFAGLFSSGVNVEVGRKNYKISLKSIPQDEEITSQIVEAGLPKIDDKVRHQIIFQLICLGKAPVNLKNYFLQPSVLAKAAEMGAIDASLVEAFMGEMTRGCSDEFKKEIVARICEAVTPFESMRAFAKELLPELNNDLTLGELCAVDVELIKALWQDCEIPEEVLNLIGRSSCFDLVPLFKSFGGGIVNVAHENIREVNSLFEQFCNGSFGCWLTQGERGVKLKTACDELFKGKGIYSLARYSIKFADKDTIPFCCEVDDNTFTFCSDKIVLKSKEPYIEIDRFVSLPATSEDLLSLQYCGKVTKAFYVEDAKNFRSIDLLSDYEKSKQQIEASRGSLSRACGWNDGASSIVCCNSSKLLTAQSGRQKFLPENRSLESKRHLVILEQRGGVKIITRVFFYSSELYTGQAFEKFNEEETEYQNKLFDNLMAMAQQHLNKNASKYTEDEQKIIGQSFEKIIQSYKETHVLPLEAMAFVVNENLEGFVNSLIRKDDTVDENLSKVLCLVDYSEEAERKAKEEAEEKARKEAEELRKQKEAEELKRKQKEAEEKRIAEEQEKARKEAEELRKQKEAEELKRKQKEAEELRKQQGFTMKEIVAKAQSVSTPMRKNTISRLIRAGKIKSDETRVNSKAQLHQILFDSFDLLNSGK